MPVIDSYYGFNLVCRECGREYLTGPTAEFTESKTNANLTGYWHPTAQPGDKILGVSEGTGSSFECMPCHVVKWLAATKD